MATTVPNGEGVRGNPATLGIRKKKNWRVDLTPLLPFIQKPPPRFVFDSSKSVECEQVEKESENVEPQLSSEVPMEAVHRGPKRAQRKNIRVDLTPFLEDIIKATQRRAELKKQFQIEAELSWKNHLAEQSALAERSEYVSKVIDSPGGKGNQENQKEQDAATDGTKDYANSSTKGETVTIVTIITMRKDGSFSMTKHSEKSGQKMPGSESVLNFCKYEGMHIVKVEYENGIKLDEVTQTEITFLVDGAKSDTEAQTLEIPNVSTTGKSPTEEAERETLRGNESDAEMPRKEAEDEIALYVTDIGAQQFPEVAEGGTEQVDTNEGAEQVAEVGVAESEPMQMVENFVEAIESMDDVHLDDSEGAD